MFSFVIKIGLALTALTSLVAILPDIRQFPDGLNQFFVNLVVPGFQLMNAMFPLLAPTAWTIISLMMYIKIVLWTFTGATWVYNKLTAIA